jgi:predicted RNA-binding Zn-ribbon protein involved in translation (DUF1610 family)
MSTPCCLVCGLTLAPDTDASQQVCADCAAQLGIAALPPPHRPPHPCVRCDQRSFVRAIPRELSFKPDAPITEATHTPMCVTYEVQPPAALGRPVLSAHDARGVLEMYICRHCGFVEWYCLDVRKVPIGPQYMTEIVEYDREERPYR